jgi:AbrB family looped-hinge helix DNA binding protein
MSEHTGSGAGKDEYNAFPMIFYDAVTVGERGQIVIPQSAREMLGIKQGSKLLVMGGIGPAGTGLILLKAEMVSSILQDVIGKLSGVAKILQEPGSDEARR